MKSSDWSCRAFSSLDFSKKKTLYQFGGGFINFGAGENLFVVGMSESKVAGKSAERIAAAY